MDANDMVEVEVWVLVDEDGDYAANVDRDELEVPTGLATRFVKITVHVPKPRPVELVATVADEPSAAELKVA